MAKLILLAVITASVSAQFEDNRRFSGERGTLRTNNDGLRVNQEYQDEGLVNPRHRHRNPENINVGGFQNGNFAHHDGRLRTNLDSRPIVNENTGQSNFQPKDDTYVVEEGAAFRRQENGQFDVHSSQGRVADASYLATQDGNYNENRRQHQNFETQQNGESIELRPTNKNQGNQNINSQTNSGHSDEYNGQQSVTRKDNNNQNRFSTQNTEERNHQGGGNNDRVTNFDQSNTRRSQNIDNNARNNPNNNNQNKFNSQNNHKNINQNYGERNDGQSISRQNVQNTDVQNNNQNTSRNQNTQSINRNQNQNSAASFDNTSDTVTKINSNSRAIADRVSNNRQNYDREAMDREINNQITQMIFEESTQPEINKNNAKTTQDNELGPSRSSSGKQDDKWIWSDGHEMKVTTKSPIIPTVDDRAAFAADQCPTGQVKFNKVCVDIDPS